MFRVSLVNLSLNYLFYWSPQPYNGAIIPYMSNVSKDNG